MAVSVAEYLGQRTDCIQEITPIDVSKKPSVLCPFMDRNCDKASKGLHPVCIVRKDTGLIWIVCEHRLCSTRTKDTSTKATYLIPHQINILKQIATTIYDDTNIMDNEVAVKREESIKLENVKISYHADYIMRNISGRGKSDKVILEMQGGGETSSTGAITRHLDAWLKESNPTNVFLSKRVAANSIETNAWRRQQEQFIVKGNVAEKSGAKMVLAIGLPLYNYLSNRFAKSIPKTNVNDDWTLCLLGFDEKISDQATEWDDREYSYIPNPIILEINPDAILFTKYSKFLEILTNLGENRPEVFIGDFTLLNNTQKKLLLS